MNRYKKIEFENFSKGGLQEFLKDENSFFDSFNTELNIKTNKIKISKSFLKKEQASYPLKDGFTDFKNYLVFAANDNITAHLNIYSQKENGAITAEYDLDTHAITLDEILWFEVFNSKIFFQGSAGAVYSYYGATALGGAWTAITGLPTDERLRKTIKKNNTLYLIFDNSIYTTQDLATFAKMTDILANFYIIDADFLGDFLHLALYENEATGTCLAKIENNELIIIKKIPRLFKIKEFNNTLLIFKNTTGIKTSIITFDGFDFTIKISLNYTPSIGCEFDEKLIFYAMDPEYSSSIIEFFVITKDFAVFKFGESEANYAIFGFREINGVLYYLAHDNDAGDDVRVYNTYLQTYNTSANIETSIINKGEIVPKQLIVRHKPLPANTSVKIYHKLDYASAYTLVLTSDTDNAIKKKYNFPAGTIADFMQFKIELVTTDTSKTPEDVQLEFLYLPIGLENAK